MRNDVSYTDSKGQQKEQYLYKATKFRELDFPFLLVKPQVLDATQIAMAAKIFDEIGIAPEGVIHSRKPDPMILGIIKAPKRGYTHKKITFLIAWFLNTDTV